MNHLSRLSYIQCLDSKMQDRLKDIYEAIFILTIDQDKEVDEKLSRELSDIACAMIDEGVDSRDKMIICSKLMEVMNRSSDNIVIKIKGFFEIASTMDEQILYWLENNQIKHLVVNTYVSSLITQVIISSRIKRGEIDIAERESEELPDCYYGLKEIATYHQFTGCYIRSLYFINKALKHSPLHLKEYFMKKRREIIFRMEE